MTVTVVELVEQLRERATILGRPVDVEVDIVGGRTVLRVVRPAATPQNHGPKEKATWPLALP